MGSRRRIFGVCTGMYIIIRLHRLNFQLWEKVILGHAWLGFKEMARLKLAKRAQQGGCIHCPVVAVGKEVITGDEDLGEGLLGSRVPVLGETEMSDRDSGLGPADPPLLS